MNGFHDSVFLDTTNCTWRWGRGPGDLCSMVRFDEPKTTRFVGYSHVSLAGQWVVLCNQHNVLGLVSGPDILCIAASHHRHHATTNLVFTFTMSRFTIFCGLHTPLDGLIDQSLFALLKLVRGPIDLPNPQHHV